MNSKEIFDKFNDITKNNKISCTEKEVDEFLMYGLLFKTKDNKFVNRSNQEINVDIIKMKTLNFNIDFTNLINTCEELAKQNKVKRIFCMTEESFNKYSDAGLIVHMQDKDYFREFDKELWLVNKI